MRLNYTAPVEGQPIGPLPSCFNKSDFVDWMSEFWFWQATSQQTLRRDS